VFGSEVCTYIHNDKMKALHSKNEKCIFVGYFKDVKGRRIFKPHSNEITIRRDVKFDEGLSACMFNSTFVPSSTCKLSSLNMQSAIPNFFASAPILVHSFLDDESEDENPPPTTHPLVESIEYKPTPSL
jgi:hypothetical protein